MAISETLLTNISASELKRLHEESRLALAEALQMLEGLQAGDESTDLFRITAFQGLIESHRAMRLLRVKMFLDHAGEIEPQMLKEQEGLIRLGERSGDHLKVQMPRSAQIPVYREPDINLHHWTPEQLMAGDSYGVSAHYVLYHDGQEIFISVVAPNGTDDIKTWTIKVLEEWRQGNWVNGSY